MSRTIALTSRETLTEPAAPVVIPIDSIGMVTRFSNPDDPRDYWTRVMFKENSRPSYLIKDVGTFVVYHVDVEESVEDIHNQINRLVRMP